MFQESVNYILYMNDSIIPLCSCLQSMCLVQGNTHMKVDTLLDYDCKGIKVVHSCSSCTLEKHGASCVHFCLCLSLLQGLHFGQ